MRFIALTCEAKAGLVAVTRYADMEAIWEEMEREALREATAADMESSWSCRVLAWAEGTSVVLALELEVDFDLELTVDLELMVDLELTVDLEPVLEIEVDFALALDVELALELEDDLDLTVGTISLGLTIDMS